MKGWRSPGFLKTKFRNDTIRARGVIPRLFLEESRIFFAMLGSGCSP